MKVNSGQITCLVVAVVEVVLVVDEVVVDVEDVHLKIKMENRDFVSKSN